MGSVTSPSKQIGRGVIHSTWSRLSTEEKVNRAIDARPFMLIITVIFIIHMIHLPTSCHPPLYWRYWTIDFSGKSPGGYSNWASLRFSGKPEVRTRRARAEAEGAPNSRSPIWWARAWARIQWEDLGPWKPPEWKSRHPGCGRQDMAWMSYPVAASHSQSVHLKGRFARHINTQDCPELQTGPPIYPFAHVFLAAWDAVGITTDHSWHFLRSKGNVNWIMEEGKL